MSALSRQHKAYPECKVVVDECLNGRIVEA